MSAALKAEIDRLTFALSDARMEIATLKDMLKAIKAASDDFRLGMGDDWEGDLLSDEIDAAATIIAKAEAREP